MHQTVHTTLNDLFKVIRKEKPTQWSVVTSEITDELGESVEVYLLSRPYIEKGEK